MDSELDVAADHLEELVIEWGPEGPPDGLAKSLARALHGTVPVVAGAGLTTPIAYRWKTQINENAKMPAFALELPELDHNEIVGWGSAGELGRFSAVFLDDADTHPRVKERIELTARLIAPGAAGVHRVESRGQNTAERVFSLVLLGDLVSLYLAVLRGVDPEPVEVLERLKAELGRRGLEHAGPARLLAAAADQGAADRWSAGVLRALGVGAGDDDRSGRAPAEPAEPAAPARAPGAAAGGAQAPAAAARDAPPGGAHEGRGRGDARGGARGRDGRRRQRRRAGPHRRAVGRL